jgi:hypothetical protein
MFNERKLFLPFFNVSTNDYNLILVKLYGQWTKIISNIERYHKIEIPLINDIISNKKGLCLRNRR